MPLHAHSVLTNSFGAGQKSGPFISKIMMWKPIITSPAAAYLQVIEKIEHDITKFEEEVVLPGFMTGKTSLALFECYYSLWKNTSKEDAITKQLQWVFDHIETLENYSLCTGLCGILSILNQLEENFLETGIQLEEYQEIAEKEAIKLFSIQDFDYLHGGMGMLNYLLDHGTSSEKIIQECLSYFLHAGVKIDGGMYWESIINGDEQLYGCNIGAAHGMPSYIYVLAKTVERYPSNALAQELFDRSIEYLISRRNPEHYTASYPSFVNSHSQHDESRLAWCYGDLGIAAALYTAGTRLERKDLINESIRIVNKCCTRKNVAENEIKDGGICHGTAGVAHIFNRFYQYTEDPAYKEAALYWVNETIRLAVDKGHHGNFKFWHGHGNWGNDLTFLGGISGIGLVLISSISDIQPKWDRYLLLS